MMPFANVLYHVVVFIEFFLSMISNGSSSSAKVINEINLRYLSSKKRWMISYLLLVVVFIVVWEADKTVLDERASRSEAARKFHHSAHQSGSNGTGVCQSNAHRSFDLFSSRIISIESRISWAKGSFVIVPWSGNRWQSIKRRIARGL